MMEKAKVDILSGLWSRGLMSQRRQPRLQAAAQEARIAALAEEAVEAGIKWSQALSFIMMQRRRTGFDWLSGADERLLITAVHAIGELMDRRGISFEETLQMIAAIRNGEGTDRHPEWAVEQGSHDHRSQPAADRSIGRRGGGGWGHLGPGEKLCYDAKKEDGTRHVEFGGGTAADKGGSFRK
ncbi:uncharacterized protein LOC118410373 [Branchiostoma floridae]|uniref:Uncharacterized protein LOC118410373 n=1 Tax=Branchiostoma floridae TaxID=7739 RepID=A0A9J7MHR5_BRAFL|nr:uncharacterized protein LOC118410373 [Branchiostoma floridae]